MVSAGPRKFAVALVESGRLTYPDDWDPMVDRANGITLSGVRAYPYTYLNRNVGGVFDTIDANANLVFGGSDDEGGVDGDDASAVINASIDALGESGGSIISVGVFPLTSSLKFHAVNAAHAVSGVSFGGLGNGCTSYVYPTKFVNAGIPSGESILDFNPEELGGQQGVSLHDFVADGVDHSVNGVTLSRVHHVDIENIRVMDCGYNLQLLGVEKSMFRNIRAESASGNALHMALSPLTSWYTHECLFENCNFLTSDYYGVDYSLPAGHTAILKFIRCSIETNGRSGAVFENAYGLGFDGCHFEGNGANGASVNYHDIYMDSCSNIKIDNTSFLFSPNETYNLKLVATDNMEILGGCRCTQSVLLYGNHSKISTLTVEGDATLTLEHATIDSCDFQGDLDAQSCSWAKFSNNSIGGTTTTTVGVQIKWENNDGYITNAKGYHAIVTGDGTSVSWAHGMDVGPRHVFISFMNNGTSGEIGCNYRVSADTTYIYLNLETAGNYTVWWSADYDDN
jgi:hypothetical protein